MTDRVGPPQRILVQLITLQAQARASEAWLYRTIETGADLIAQQTVGRHYLLRIVLRDEDATLDALVDALAEATSVPDVRAVDLLLNPHGTSRRLLFTDRSVESDEVAAALRTALSAEQRSRLRAAFSTACYGRTHTADWRAAGFVVATGATGVYADGTTSLPTLLRAWASGRTVRAALDRANRADPGRIQDRIAWLFYRLSGRGRLAAAVDSHRVADGSTEVRIDTDPRELTRLHRATDAGGTNRVIR